MAINARAAAREQIGGVERYAREMARRLPALRRDRYVAMVPHPALAHRTGHLWEQAVLPLRTRRFALLYSPANVAPALAPRNLAVIHDAAVLREPESYSRGYVAFHSRLLRRLTSQARIVITDSEFSRGELCELLGLSPDRFRVVPAGVGECFSSPGLDEQGRRKYGLHRPYVLSVATFSARKNLDVLAAASRVLSEHQIDLVVAGGGRSYLRERGSSLRRLGYVPDADLPALYAGARAFVMPSRYEGFGLPCLEAMASGVPVIAARAGALPETVGEAGVLVDPSDADGFADGLLRLIDDARLRTGLIAKGRDRAKLLSWERTAVMTDEIVSELIG